MFLFRTKPQVKRLTGFCLFDCLFYYKEYYWSKLPDNVYSREGISLMVWQGMVDKHEIIIKVSIVEPQLKVIAQLIKLSKRGT